MLGEPAVEFLEQGLRLRRAESAKRGQRAERNRSVHHLALVACSVGVAALQVVVDRRDQVGDVLPEDLQLVGGTALRQICPGHQFDTVVGAPPPGSDPHQPSLLNAALFTLGSGLQHAPPLLAAEGMLLAQSVFNFFVTSGSAQAAITMPLMAGLGDLIGVSRQIAVLAFQLGDGLTNLIIPTSGAMMGAIGMAGLDWLAWLRLIWRFELCLLAAAASSVALAVLVGYA